MKISLIFLITCITSATFKLELYEHSTSKLTSLLDTLTLTPESESTSIASVPKLLKSIKEALIPALFTLSLVSGASKFTTTFEINEKSKFPALNFEVLTDAENSILNISLLIGNDQKTPVSVSLKKITNLDFQTVDPSSFKTKMPPPKIQPTSSSRNPGESTNNEVPPPPVEEEQTFFKKYFWYIVIGGMIAFNLLTADTGKLKDAYNQAQPTPVNPERK